MIKILNGNAKVLPGCKENDPTIWLDRLAAIFRYFKIIFKCYDLEINHHISHFINTDSYYYFIIEFIILMWNYCLLKSFES